jgi:ADP-heptose:LPS heptosyltransferase
MLVDTLRRLDRYIGIPLCWLLSLARRVYSLISAKQALPKPRKVLIIKLSEMGSSVLAYPALAELKTRSPDIQLHFLVFANNVAILEALNLAPTEHFVTVDYRTPARLLKSGFKVLRQLLRERFDTTIDMDFFSRLTALISFLVCRGNRVGFYQYNDEGLYRGDLLTHRVLYSPHVHTALAFISLVRSLFQEPGDEPYYRGHISPSELTVPLYQPEEMDRKSVRQKLSLAGIDPENGPLVLINPNSSEIFLLRKWPLNYYAQLCSELLVKIPQSVLVITGLASEKADATYIQAQVQSSRCIDFTGQVNFRELLALYSLASLMVTNDSGPAHFASLLRLPTVVLFGPETPRLYSPLGDYHKDMYSHFACSPCVSVYNGKKSPCRENRCLMAITPQAVLAEVMSLLGDKAMINEAAPDKKINSRNDDVAWDRTGS